MRNHFAKIIYKWDKMVNIKEMQIKTDQEEPKRRAVSASKMPVLQLDTVAQPCNPNTLGGQGSRIAGIQEFETSLGSTQ